MFQAISIQDIKESGDSLPCEGKKAQRKREARSGAKYGQDVNYRRAKNSFER
jgi:hypothetical protein